MGEHDEPPAYMCLISYLVDGNTAISFDQTLQVHTPMLRRQASQRDEPGRPF